MDSIDIIKNEPVGYTNTNTKKIAYTLYNHFSDMTFIYFHATVLSVLCVLIYIYKPLSIVQIKLKKNGYTILTNHGAYLKLCLKMILLYVTIIVILLILQ